jgi:hypothetical protein
LLIVLKVGLLLMSLYLYFMGVYLSKFSMKITSWSWNDAEKDCAVVLFSLPSAERWVVSDKKPINLIALGLELWTDDEFI